MADFFSDSGSILAWIISVLILGTFVWRIAVWQNTRMENDAARKEAQWKKYSEEQAKIVKQEFENAMELVRDDVKELRITATKQLRRSNKRSDFTNSNVQKVRMDSLDHQVELHRMKKAMADKGIIVNDEGQDSLFDREIRRKRTEIENDARIQLPQDDDLNDE
jgi:hypothetical protein